VWRKIWDALTEKPWFAFLFLGILLFLAVFTDEIPKTGIKIHDSPYQIFLLIAGGLLILAAVFLAIRQEISPSVPSTPPQSSGKAAPPKINPKLYNVSISKPKPVRASQSPVKLVGTIAKPLTEDVELWLFSVGARNLRPTYWPYQKIQIPDKKNWDLEYKSGTGKRVIQLYLVGKDGQALIASFFDINGEFLKMHGGSHQPLLAITSDIVPACEPLHVEIEPPSA